ncbi:MAG: DUF5688 family protein [Lachnospiraceae bacterium]|nr:DUF5688 family protein [Lachnospiraceae bacterium]
MEESKRPEEAGIDEIYRWENAKKWVHRKVVPAGKNRDCFKEVVYTPFLDLEEQYYIGGVRNDRLITITVTESFLKTWDITKEDLEAQAVENMREDDYRMMPMEDVLGLSGMELFPEQDRLYVVTNHKGVFGAAVITEPEILTEFAAQLGGDTYILPSSVHELLLIPASTQNNADWLRRIVHEVNREAVPENEFLSDNIYYFRAAEKTVEIVPKKQIQRAV